jgi:cytochrome P450
METLRITHPLSLLVKTTGPTSQPLTIKGTVYNIPAETSVHLSIAAMNTLPRYWGANPMEYNPGRFMSTSDVHGSIEAEILAPDTQDHFMPWAWGQRVCPGKRFSQVELVAVLAVLFRNWRVSPVPEGNETISQARVRAWRSSLVVDHQGHMLHEIVRPDRVGLQWTKE